MPKVLILANASPVHSPFPNLKISKYFCAALAALKDYKQNLLRHSILFSCGQTQLWMGKYQK
jgi:hypothetical protein